MEMRSDYNDSSSYSSSDSEDEDEIGEENLKDIKSHDDERGALIRKI